MAEKIEIKIPEKIEEKIAERIEKGGEKKEWRKWNRWGGGGGSAIYGIGILGALVYFIQHASTFGDGLLGIIKALLWPAVIVYKVLEQFHL